MTEVFIVQFTDVPEFPDTGAFNTVPDALAAYENGMLHRSSAMVTLTVDLSGTDVTIGIENQERWSERRADECRR